MPLTRDISKVMVGPGAIYVAPEDTANLADTVALFTEPVDPWIYPGFTNEGVNSAFERDIQFHYVEEQSAPARVTVNTSTLSIATAFAEDTLDNYLIAVGGGTLTKTAPSTGVIGKSVFNYSDTLDISAVILEAENPWGFFRRFYAPRMVATGSVEMNNRRSDSKRAYATSFQSISDIADVVIKDKTAAAS